MSGPQQAGQTARVRQDPLLFGVRVWESQWDGMLASLARLSLCGNHSALVKLVQRSDACSVDRPAAVCVQDPCPPKEQLPALLSLTGPPPVLKVRDSRVSANGQQEHDLQDACATDSHETRASANGREERDLQDTCHTRATYSHDSRASARGQQQEDIQDRRAVELPERRFLRELVTSLQAVRRADSMLPSNEVQFQPHTGCAHPMPALACL
jgi:hypothetical protein